MTTAHKATWKETLKIAYSPIRLPSATGFVEALPTILMREGTNLLPTQFLVTAEPFTSESEGELAKDAVVIQWQGDLKGAFHMDGPNSPIDKHAYTRDATINAETGEQAILLLHWARWRHIAAIRLEIDVDFDILHNSIIAGLSQKPDKALRAMKSYLHIHRELFMALPHIF